MFGNSKQQALYRDALKNAAIYGALADGSEDPDRRRDYGRLRDIEIGLARQWHRRARQRCTPSVRAVLNHAAAC